MQLRQKTQKPWDTRGPTYSDLRNVQLLQNIPGTVWQMNSEKPTGTMLLLSETGKSNSYAFTNGIDEIIFIFKEF